MTLLEYKHGQRAGQVTPAFQEGVGQPGLSIVIRSNQHLHNASKVCFYKLVPFVIQIFQMANSWNNRVKFIVRLETQYLIEPKVAEDICKAKIFSLDLRIIISLQERLHKLIAVEQFFFVSFLISPGNHFGFFKIQF